MAENIKEQLKLFEEKLKKGKIVNILGMETIIIPDLEGLSPEFIALYLISHPYKRIFVYNGKGKEVINIYFDETESVCKMEKFDVYELEEPYGKEIREILGIEKLYYIG
jgi:hypothetical protein